MSSVLTSKDLFTFEPPTPVEYPREPSFNFAEYKERISLLLVHFFDDILSLEEKVHAVELIAHKNNSEMGGIEGLIERLKRSIVTKVDFLTSSMNDGIISDRNQLIRRQSTYHSSTIPSDLSIEYLQSYIREKLSPLLPSLYKNFYKSPAGPNDAKLASIIQKISKLDEFFGSTNESNILSRLSFHYIELLSFMFSNSSRADLAKQIPNLISLNMKYIAENILEAGGADWMKSQVTARNTFANKENLIDKINAMALEQPKSFTLNLDALFKLKLVRDKIDIKHELCSHVEKAL
jgi:hypothetical protein